MRGVNINEDLATVRSEDTLAQQVEKLKNHVAITKTATEKAVTLQTLKIKSNQKTVANLQSELDAARELLDIQYRKVSEIE